jgi:5,10-methylenetetrahydromethanopterin reductase
MTPLTIGTCFHPNLPARLVIDQAKAAEAAGYGELWVIEDCFFTSGPSLAAAALTATEQITVGIGIMPAVARNPAIAAMEIATLCGLGPGRFHAGIGHGMAEWMAQIGEQRDSPVTILDETLVAVRRLLAGERVTVKGRYVSLRDVELAAPPSPVPLVSAGVRGPVSMSMAGRSADGVILADFCSPDYVRSCRELLSAAASAGTPPHRVTCFASAAIGPDGNLMRRIMAELAAGPFAAGHASIRALSFYPEVAAKAERQGWPDALATMPAEWWSQIAPVGTPDDAAAYLLAMADAGTDCVALFPDPSDPVASAVTALDALRPLLT